MAYGSNTGKSSYGSNSTGTKSTRKTYLRTGLFVPSNGKSKAMGSVKLDETVTIPAGSYINLYKNDQKKTPNHPDFTLQIVEGISAK